MSKTWELYRPTTWPKSPPSDTEQAGAAAAIPKSRTSHTTTTSPTTISTVASLLRRAPRLIGSLAMLWYARVDSVARTTTYLQPWTGTWA